jgi:hypothetical protein
MGEGHYNQTSDHPKNLRTDTNVEKMRCEKLPYLTVKKVTTLNTSRETGIDFQSKI